MNIWLMIIIFFRVFIVTKIFLKLFFIKYHHKTSIFTKTSSAASDWKIFWFFWAKKCLDNIKSLLGEFIALKIYSLNNFTGNQSYFPWLACHFDIWIYFYNCLILINYLHCMRFKFFIELAKPFFVFENNQYWLLRLC